MAPSIIVHASCATTNGCQDTSTSPDLSWMSLPGLLLVAVVLAVIVYFAVKGSRGR